MSSKYSEKNVVKIKQDIKKYSDELLLIQQKKSEAEIDLKKFPELVNGEKKKLIIACNQLTEQSIILKSEIGRLQVQVERLNNEIEALSIERERINKDIISSRSLYQEDKHKFEEFKNSKSTTYIDSVISEARNILAGIQSKILSEAKIFETLESQRKNAEQAVSLVRDQELATREALTKVNSEYMEKKHKVEELQSLIEDTNRREHDLKIMEMRLTPEYQKVYFRDKKNKKPHELRN